MLKRTINTWTGLRFRLTVLEACAIVVGDNVSGFHFDDPNEMARVVTGFQIKGGCVVLFPDETTQDEEEAAYEEMKTLLIAQGWGEEAFVMNTVARVSHVPICE